jgi:hypothetical protein
MKTILSSTTAEKAALKTTATNKRLCGSRISYGHPNFTPCPTLRREKASVTRYSLVSCRLFPVTAGKILPAGSSALRKTSHNLAIGLGCNKLKQFK